MIVTVEEIREAGLSVEHELTAEWLAQVLAGEGQGTGFRAAGPARLAAHFKRAGGKLLLEGDARLRLVGQCRRCLTDIELDVPVEFELDLVARKPASAGGDEDDEEARKDAERAASFDLEGVDEESFDGREIDLAAIAREQVLLALPMDGLCKDACKGLCSVCGQDLNLKECGCQRKVADPRWAALKNIKLT